MAFLLSKFEGRQGKSDNSGISQIISGSEEDQVSAELTRDLNSKSIEELILINFNPEEYINEFTQKQRDINFALLEEVTKLADTTENLKREYAQTKAVIDGYKQEYEVREKELIEVIEQKKMIDGRFSVENLIQEMRKNLEDNYQKPKQQLIADFFSKKINFDTFKENFKELNQKYHYYNIIKDKMNLYK